MPRQRRLWILKDQFSITECLVSALKSCKAAAKPSLLAVFYLHCFFLLCVGVNGYTSHWVTKEAMENLLVKDYMLILRAGLPHRSRGTVLSWQMSECSSWPYGFQWKSSTSKNWGRVKGASPCGGDKLFHGSHNIHQPGIFMVDIRTAKEPFPTLTLILGQMPSAGVNQACNELPSHGTCCMWISTWWGLSPTSLQEHSQGSGPLLNLIFVAIAVCHSLHSEKAWSQPGKAKHQPWHLPQALGWPCSFLSSLPSGSGLDGLQRLF